MSDSGSSKSSSGEVFWYVCEECQVVPDEVTVVFDGIGDYIYTPEYGRDDCCAEPNGVPYTLPLVTPDHWYFPCWKPDWDPNDYPGIEYNWWCLYLQDFPTSCYTGPQGCDTFRVEFLWFPQPHTSNAEWQARIMLIKKSAEDCSAEAYCANIIQTRFQNGHLDLNDCLHWEFTSEAYGGSSWDSDCEILERSCTVVPGSGVATWPMP